jgi:DNA-binding beta-propeller fold protein YncE
LYLCDTKNHAIREINMAKKEVLTVIGTGEKGNDKEGNKNPEEQKLSSPWDIVAINRDTLIFAMAGTHQIWALNLKTNRGFVFSGNGREGNFNCKSDLKECEWAQPSGLSLGIISNNKIELYVADSESSAIRSINMKTLQASRLLVGGDKNPKNLHAYGDQDGQSEVAKLQHPLGVCFIPDKNVIAVTDTYNHKIKVIDPFNNEIFSWLGNGQATLVDDQTFDASLNEPSGICSIFDPAADDIKVFIADCNNHCIRYVHYDTGILTTPEFKGVPSVL